MFSKRGLAAGSGRRIGFSVDFSVCGRAFGWKMGYMAGVLGKKRVYD